MLSSKASLLILLLEIYVAMESIQTVRAASTSGVALGNDQINTPRGLKPHTAVEGPLANINAYSHSDGQPRLGTSDVVCIMPSCTVVHRQDHELGLRRWLVEIAEA